MHYRLTIDRPFQHFIHDLPSTNITMPEPVERGQSPPPERSSGKQMHDPPASGKGTDDATNKKQTNKTGLEVRNIYGVDLEPS